MKNAFQWDVYRPLIDRILQYSGGGWSAPPMQNPPVCPPPRMQTCPDAEPPGHVTCDACWEANPLPRWAEGTTHACENMTLPQTSFGGGNKPSDSDITFLFAFLSFNVNKVLLAS